METLPKGVHPFNISVPQSQLDTLQSKLSQATFPDELDNDSDKESTGAWNMGAPLPEIVRLTNYWRDGGFDWRKAEKNLNDRMPQYTTAVPVIGFGDIHIHFVWKRAEDEKKRGIPILFIHGWPGSFIEVMKLLPFLTKPDDDSQPVFDVIAPSLPNFGFSEGIKKRGFGLAQYAEAMHNLMLALGYQEYVVQGGDWGGMISRVMAYLYGPSHVKAAHLNFAPVFPPYPWRHPLLFLQTLFTLPFSRKDWGKLMTTRKYIDDGSGYLKQQDTRPQTLGYALHDSPVALLAWIYEKLHSWSDSYPWTDDEILTWVSIYAFSSAGPAASVRIYYESMHAPPSLKSSSLSGEAADDQAKVKSITRPEMMASRSPPGVKIGIAQFPKEIALAPFVWCRAIGDVVRESEPERGGHFAAYEVPELLAQDIRSFLGKRDVGKGIDGQAFGAVDGRDGY